MKELLTVVVLLVNGVVSEVPAPYAASGWRPEGPAFELPQRTQPALLQPQQYLPPVDPRGSINPNFDNGADVSVQGLPIIEQQPIFEVSPINGQLYSGPSINADLTRLNPSLQQIQYEQQLERARQFARQREFENSRARVPSSDLPNIQLPRQFASQTTTTTLRPEIKTAEAETTTESDDLNEGESLDNSKNTKKEKENISVEVSKQNLQEYPPEIFLNPLAQLKLQPQFISLPQFGQLRAPLIYQAQVKSPVQGFGGPAHLSALPSVLAQRELLSQKAQLQSQNFVLSPIIVQQDQQSSIQEPLDKDVPVSKQNQPPKPTQPIQPVQAVLPDQNIQPLRPRQPDQSDQQNYPQVEAQPATLPRQPADQIQSDIQFQQQQLNYQPQQQQFLQQQLVQPQFQYQFQPQLSFQPQPLQPNQFAQPQPQPRVQPQPQQPKQFAQPQRPKDVEEIEQTDQQVVYQNYQPQFYQPQFPAPNQYQNSEQPLFIAQPAFAYQNQEQYYHNQFPQQQFGQSQLTQPQDGQPLQSGLDINQQGNDIDQEEQDQGDDQEEEEGRKATAVATAFGTRTQPRVFAQYGAPIPKVQEIPAYQTTAEPSPQEEPQDEEGPAIAQATAVATGRRNAKLRARRVRPIFTVDRSGHLVLAQQS